MSQLFKRGADLTLSKPQLGSYFGQFLPNAVVIRKLRVKFKIERTLEKTPNTCVISVYNLSAQTRAAFQSRPLHVQLDVGYGDERARLFSGDLMYADSVRDGSGVDWVTEFTCGDGERAYVESRVNRSFGAGVSPKAAVAEIAGSMGLKLPHSIAEAKELAGSFVSGISLHGPSQTAMTKVLQPRGLGWSIQDGELQILSSTGVRADTAILISQKTGMVGTPELGPPKKPGEPPTLKVKTLIYSALVPGGRIKLDALRLSGLFRIQRVTHTGDTRDKDWFSEIEAMPL